MNFLASLKATIAVIRRGQDHITFGIYFSIWMIIELTLAIHHGNLRNHIQKYFDTELVIAQFAAVFTLFVIYCAISFVRIFNKISIKEIKADKKLIILVFDELYKVPIFFSALLIASGVIDLARDLYFVAFGNQTFLPYAWSGLLNLGFGIFLFFFSALINGVLIRSR